MRNYFRRRSIIGFGFVCAVLICTISFTKAGTILLMGIGLGTPGGVAPGGCGGVVGLGGCVTAFTIGIQ